MYINNVEGIGLVPMTCHPCITEPPTCTKASLFSFDRFKASTSFISSLTSTCSTTSHSMVFERSKFSRTKLGDCVRLVS
uniref:Uncharacterized protein n=1 Tax=Ciona intestinalis TaxID=7719 RepID=H2Y3P8_CIOIN